MTRLVLTALAAAAVSLPLTLLVRAQGRGGRLLDQPNERSSHTVATPRGGGVAFVVVTLLGAAFVAARGTGDDRLALALLLGGVPVAVVGLTDDVRGLPAAVRAAVHAVAALVAIAVLDPPFDQWRMPLLLLSGVALVWLINLYNFMDGIDGLAAGQAIVACAALVLLTDSAGTVPLTAALLAGAVAGFLVLNRPRASIFMGDVGSGFLGLALGALVLAAYREANVPILLAVLPVAPFLVDATGTLVARVLAGERWYDAHRDHLYQRLVRGGRTHGQVTAAYVALAALLAVEVRLLLGRRGADLAAIATVLLLFAAWLFLRRRTHPGAGRPPAA